VLDSRDGHPRAGEQQQEGSEVRCEGDVAHRRPMVEVRPQALERPGGRGSEHRLRRRSDRSGREKSAREQGDDGEHLQPRAKRAERSLLQQCDDRRDRPGHAEREEQLLAPCLLGERVGELRRQCHGRFERARGEAKKERHGGEDRQGGERDPLHHGRPRDRVGGFDRSIHRRIQNRGSGRSQPRL
jgi:hypothetical protein